MEASKRGILTYGIIENVWNHNFVRATNIILIEQAELYKFKVYVKDSDFEQQDIDRFIMDNPDKFTNDRVNGTYYTLFTF